MQRLIKRVDPVRVSEHLCWSSVDGVFLNDLLPLPCTEATLAYLITRVSVLQDYLARQILVENVSSYLEFPGGEIPEWEFLVQLARRSGCGILLDLNNLYVSAQNQGFAPEDYLDAVPAELVGEIHLAGHTAVDGLLIDTHSGPVSPPVWALYQRALERLGGVPTLIEWDAELPSLDRLLAEAARADAARVPGGCG